MTKFSTFLNGLTEDTTPDPAADFVVTYDADAATSKKVKLSNITGSSSVSAADSQDFRITLESGVPASTSDQANKTTVYVTPYRGNQISLYDGAATWNTFTSAEMSVAVGAYTASKPYDVFIYDNAGTPTIETLVWTNGTTRATALVYQNGRLVKTGATTRRYIGTIYIDAGQKCQDTLLLRYVYNYYNRINRKLLFYDAAAHTATNQTTWRQWNNSAAAQVVGIWGVQEDDVFISFGSNIWTNTNAKSVYLACAVDATTPHDPDIGYGLGQFPTAANAKATAARSGYKSIAAGYHYVALIEAGDTSSIASYEAGALHVVSGR